MKTTGILSVVVSLSTLSLGACGPFDPDPEDEIPDQASYCSTSFEEDFPEAREVELGFGPAAAFQPYRDGDEVEMVVGGQGAPMITPLVRVERAAGDAAEPCFRVRVVEGVSEFASEWNIQFREEGDHLLSDGALYFITSSTDEVELTLTVYGEGFSGTRKVNVVLK